MNFLPPYEGEDKTSFVLRKVKFRPRVKLLGWRPYFPKTVTTVQCQMLKERS